LPVGSYEDVIRDPQMFFDEQVFPFLQLDSVRVHTPLRKQNRRSGIDSIQNHESVLPLLQTGCAQLDIDWNLGER